MPNLPVVRIMASRFDAQFSETSTSAGSSESEQKALTVVPCGRPPSWLVTTASGVHTAPSASRKAPRSTVALTAFSTFCGLT